MAAVKPNPLGSLALGVAKLGLKSVITAVGDHASLVERIAAAVYEEETGRSFSKLEGAERVLWLNRVRGVIRAASSMVNV